ncbi:nitroreductase family protein [Gudongella sp. DL1XJH-153]|uniref:nitroreductase family protein n=1 Tax=Gudongella sp. DL1XJH-153 TaxID=3409804 RepID=UPI003BB6B3E9
MNMTSFLKSRKSTREFKKKSVTEKDLANVKAVIDEINDEVKGSNMEVKLYEFGKRIFDSLKGVGGYSGVMIESPHYIALDMKSHGPEEKLNSGYYMERIVTRLNDMGIGTCWVGLNNLDMERMKAIFGENTGDNDYLLAIGYPKPKNPFVHEQFSERLGVEEIAFRESLAKPADVDFLEERGLGDLLFYIRFAPSSKNLQPWRFIIHDSYVELAIEEMNGEFCYTDAGIAMYYFEELAKTQGIKHKWDLDMRPQQVKGKKYMFIGKYEL